MSGLTLAQKKIVIGSFLGWSLDGYDIVLMLLVVPSISQLFFPSENQLFSILATFATYTVTLIMRPLGGAIFGIYGDKFGRKKSMVIIWRRKTLKSLFSQHQMYLEVILNFIRRKC